MLLPCATPAIEQVVRDTVSGEAYRSLKITPVSQQSREVLAASDVALIKSGTSTLEAALLGVPMVVGYRLGFLTYQIVRRLLRTPHVALPNILAGEQLVPEFLQDDMQPAALAHALVKQMDVEVRQALRARFHDYPPVAATTGEPQRGPRAAGADRCALRRRCCATAPFNAPRGYPGEC